MRLCKECRRTGWPYLIAILVAGFAAFLTWLTLAAAGFAPQENLRWTLGMLVGVAVALSLYVASCMRRHCRHGVAQG